MWEHAMWMRGYEQFLMDRPYHNTRIESETPSARSCRRTAGRRQATAGQRDHRSPVARTCIRHHRVAEGLIPALAGCLAARQPRRVTTPTPCRIRAYREIQGRPARHHTLRRRIDSQHGPKGDKIGR